VLAQKDAKTANHLYPTMTSLEGQKYN